MATAPQAGLAPEVPGIPADDWRRLFLATPGLFLVLDSNLVIVTASDAYLEATTTRRDQILGRHLFDVFPDNPDDPGATGTRNLKASLERVLASKASDAMTLQKYDIRRPEATGGGFEERYWSSVNSPVLDDTGNVSYIIHRVEDVTEFVRLAKQKRSMDALRAAREEIQDIYDKAPCGYHSLDENGRYVRVNDTELSWLGYRRDEVLGKRFTRFCSRRSAGKFKRAFERFKATGTMSGLELDLVRKDGRMLPAVLNATAIRDAAGRFRRSRTTLMDLTETKKNAAEAARRTEELRQARHLNRLKDLFLSGISHEMKTPLSLIIGYAEMLQEGLAEAWMIDGILEGGRRLESQLNAILDYSALLSGALPLYLGEVNVSEIVGNIAAALEPGFRAEGKTLQIDVDPVVPPIRADARRISQMITELLDNARKFTEPGASVGVRARSLGTEVEVAVWDTGRGIPEAELARIWEAFAQVDASESARKGGLGLGLTTVEGLAELHGGGVSAESRLGEGSTFSLRLPVSGPATAWPGS